MQQSLRLIDVTRLIFRLLKGKRATGVDRVGLAYIAHYQSKAQAVLAWKQRVAVLDQGRSQQVFHALLSDVPLQSKWYWYRLLAHLSLAKIDRRFHGCFFINTGHKGLESKGYADTLKKMGVRPIYFVHDLIPLTHPEYCRPDEQLKHEQRMLRMLNDAEGLIVNSQYTKDETLLFAQRQKIACPPIAVAWLASKFQSHQTEAISLTVESIAPYFIALSTIEPRKNHLLLLHIWRKMVEVYGRDAVPKLILIGQRGWECEQVIDLLDRCDQLKGVVIEKNHCTDNELQSLLSSARALLFPSFVEGFGMPLVEALCSGIPVIASDIAVFREIGQNIPEFVDENDGPAWIRLVQAYAQTDSSLRDQQLMRMRDYQPWLWADHFKAVDHFLEQLSHASE